ncbi:MAG TPA: GntR family transcriptional regulator [Planctomycetia bacterium]|nr:GntR family transcriptional regulator [Planctomycetia bacterium]
MSIPRLRCPELVRRTIVERIVAGVYQPGDRLIELQLARELGVSQAPVREALRELEAARMVESTPHRGTRVRVESAKEMRDAYFTRGILEEGAARGAAKAFKGKAVALRAACEAIIAAAEAGELPEQAAANQTFHRMIVAAAGNEVLLRLWDELAFETRTRVRLARDGAKRVADAKTHRPIVDALEKGDGRSAGKLLREHSESFAPAEHEGTAIKLESTGAR